MQIVDATPPPSSPPPPSPNDKIEDVLAHSDRPLTRAEIRQTCRMRMAHVCQALAALTAQGRVHKTAAGYQRAAP